MEATVQPPSLPSSPLSVLTKSPSPPPAPSRALELDMSNRYPSPSSSAPSGSTSPRKLADAPDEICVRGDGGPPRKKRKVAAPKLRTTERIDLSERTAEDEEHLDRLLRVLRKKKKIVVIAGAGISVSAGIPDFRSSKGLFKSTGKDLFDASVYRHDSQTEKFHNMVRELAHLTQNAKPTAFHHMLASIAAEGRLLRLYSQNVDAIDVGMEPLATTVPLNRKGPWPKSIQLHGGLQKMECTKCGDLEPFNGSLFEGPEAPLCEKCKEQDEVRVAFANKRSHGIGRLRPRIVLYNEYNPDEEAIGNVSKADLRRIPDAVIVVGTSLKIPGVKRIVKEMCTATRSTRDGFTAWINLESEPKGVDFENAWDLVVRGKCDDVAELTNLPRWNEQDIGERESYMVSGDVEKEESYKRAVERVKIEVPLQRKKSPEAESETGSARGDRTNAKRKLVEHALPTPTASPRIASQVDIHMPKAMSQSKLLFPPGTAAERGTSTTIAKSKKLRRPKQNLKKPRPKKNDLMKTFKATKNVGSTAKKAALEDATPKTPTRPDSDSSDLSSPPEDPDDDSTSLPTLRPQTPVRQEVTYYTTSDAHPRT